MIINHFPYIKNLTSDEVEILLELGKTLKYKDIFNKDKFKISLGNKNYIEIPKIFREIFLPIGSIYPQINSISRLVYSTDITIKDNSLSSNKKDKKKLMGFSYLMSYLMVFSAYSLPSIDVSDYEEALDDLAINLKFNLFATTYTGLDPLTLVSNDNLVEFINNFIFYSENSRIFPKNLFIQELYEEYLDNK